MWRPACLALGTHRHLLSGCFGSLITGHDPIKVDANDWSVDCKWVGRSAQLPIASTALSEIDGGVKPSGRATLSFVEFMLEVCLGEVGYMTAALNRSRLREAVMHVFRLNSRLTEAGVRPETAPAFFALLIQGALPGTDFETFTGLQPSEASDQLSRLINVGIAVSAASNRMRPGITPCVIRPAATYAAATRQSHSPAASAVA